MIEAGGMIQSVVSVIRTPLGFVRIRYQDHDGEEMMVEVEYGHFAGSSFDALYLN